MQELRKKRQLHSYICDRKIIYSKQRNNHCHYTCQKCGKIIHFDKISIEEIHVNQNNLEESNYLIFENSKEIFEKNSKAFFIGGDHSISFPILNAFNKIEKNPFLIIFDAHADCMKPGKEPTHEEWLRALVEKGFLAKRAQ